MEEDSGSDKQATEEVYVIEHCRETNMVISGGGNDAVTFHVFNGSEYVVDEVIEGLEDSVVFASFVTPSQAVAVSMDGCIVYIRLRPSGQRLEKEVLIAPLQLDVSAVAVAKEQGHLYLGTKDGTVGRVRATLDAAEQDSGWDRLERQYLGHPSDVLCIEARAGLLFTASHTQVLVFDPESAGISKRFFSQEEAEIRTMAVHAQGRLAAVGYSNGAVLVLSLSAQLPDLQVVHRTSYSGPVETMVFTPETLQYGGFGEALHVVELRDKTETVIPLPEETACVVAILPVTEAITIAVMNSGKVFVTNAKKRQQVVKEYTFHSCVFAAALAGSVLCGGTQEGLELIDLAK